MANTQKSSSARPQPSANLSLAKKILFALTAILLTLAGLELGLTLLGVQPAAQNPDPFVSYTSSLPLFVPENTRPGSPPHLRTAANKLRLFNDQRFPAQKDAGTFRLFSVGGSTTYGRPYDDPTSFNGWLREYLRKAAPDRRFEVINAGGISYASYRVALLMEELARYEPDLFIVYSGHNEFLEERTYRSVRNRSRISQALLNLASRSRAATLVQRTLQSTLNLQPDSREGAILLPTEVVTLLDKSVGPSAYHRDDPQRDAILEHYRFNLNRMIDIAQSVHAKVLFVIPASNLHGISPFKSQHSDGLSQEQLEAFASLYLQAKQLYARQDYEGALAKLDEAIQIDQRFAEIHFYRGYVLERLQRDAEAKNAFINARDEDVCPLRALSPLTRILIDVAQTREIPLVDFVAIQESLSPRGIPGETVFVDHVHPTTESNQQLAQAILKSLVQQDWIETDVAPETIDWSDVHERVLSQIDPEAHAEALMNLSKVLGWAGKLSDAYRLATQAAELAPTNAGAQYQAGLTAQLTDRNEEAILHYRKTIALRPDFALAQGNLGVALEQTGDFAGAAHHFQLAIQCGTAEDIPRNKSNLQRVQQKLQGQAAPDPN